MSMVDFVAACVTRECSFCSVTSSTSGFTPHAVDILEMIAAAVSFFAPLYAVQYELAATLAVVTL